MTTKVSLRSRSRILFPVLVIVVLFAFYIYPTEWSYRDFGMTEKGRGGVGVHVASGWQTRTNQFTGEEQFCDSNSVCGSH